MSDTLGQIIMVAGAVAFMHTLQGGGNVGKSKEASIAGGVNPDLAYDPSRWRHDGSQPISRRNGNGPLNENYTVQRLYDLID